MTDTGKERSAERENHPHVVPNHSDACVLPQNAKRDILMNVLAALFCATAVNAETGSTESDL